MTQTIAFSGSKKEWIGKRKVNARGLPLVYNVSLKLRYQHDLEVLVFAMTKATKMEFERLARNTSAMDADDVTPDYSVTTQSKRILNALRLKFQKLFNARVSGIVDKMLKNTLKTSAVTLSQSLKQLTGGLILNTSSIPKGLEFITQAIVAENVSLIKSIPQEYFNDITGSVMRSISSGNGLFDLIPQIEKYNGITRKRATLIASDQTRKAYSAINRERLTSAGVKKFRWHHSGGSQTPRPSHVAMDNVIFSFDNLPIINADNKGQPPVRGIPGQAINCLCFMEPIVEMDDGREV